MFGKAGVWELLIILALALLIFGPKALPKLGESLGKTIGSFKKGLSEDEDGDKKKDVAEAETKSDTEDGKEA